MNKIARNGSASKLDLSALVELICLYWTNITVHPVVIILCKSFEIMFFILFVSQLI